MLVKTPAVKLAVEIRVAAVADGKIRLEGVSGAMPCSIDVGPGEALALIRLALRRDIVALLWRGLFRPGGTP